MTGIDRVELSYAEYLAAHERQRTRFVAFDYWRGRFGFLPMDSTVRLIQRIGPCWRDGTLSELWNEAALLFAASLFVLPSISSKSAQSRPTYLNVSSHPLHRTRAIGAMLKYTGAAFVPMLHDVIPLEMPEYVPRKWVREHRECMKTISMHADGLICNSMATRTAAQGHLPQNLPTVALPLGVSTMHGSSKAGLPKHVIRADRPYFVCLGTVEPRKNHLLLLHLWRSMSVDMDECCPDLFIVGRRGWDNKHVFSLLDRCEGLTSRVREAGQLSDAEVIRLMSGAAALLMPSFAEGYGLPVAEALSRGLPVLCSDLPAHREIGGGVPEYLDPLDGVGWRRAVEDYATPFSARRRAQVERMRGWSCSTWHEHVTAAISFIDELAGIAPRKHIRPSVAQVA